MTRSACLSNSFSPWRSAQLNSLLLLPGVPGQSPRAGAAPEGPWQSSALVLLCPVTQRFPACWPPPQAAHPQRSGDALLLAHSSPRDTRFKASPQQLSGDTQLPCVHCVRSPCASCNAPDRGSKYFRHLHCASAGMHCEQKKRAVCCIHGRSEARDVRGGFS